MNMVETETVAEQTMFYLTSVFTSLKNYSFKVHVFSIMPLPK